MDKKMITPDELIEWVPGKLLLDSLVQGYDGMRLRSYRYKGEDVSIPPMRDFMIVVYKQGMTQASRRCDGGWKTENLLPGDVTLLTRAVPSQWHWNDPIEVTHLYLSPSMVADVAVEVFERDINEIELRDILRVEDSVLPAIAAQLEREVQLHGIGERLYTETLRLQASIQLLRHYANVRFRDVAASGQLSAAQRQRLLDYALHALDRPITLNDLAAQIGISVFQFCRRFRATFGIPPHLWLLEQRVARAMAQIRRGDAPLKLIALDAGFSDQSHMTRVFRRMAGVTPGEYRGNFASTTLE